VPSVYLQNARDFLNRAPENFKLMEWQREGWTWHAKGLWIESPKEKRVATIVGSSNFGYRSVHRDLEAQVLLVTEDKNLRNKIFEERKTLFEHAYPIDLSIFAQPNHLIPTWVKYLTRFVRTYF